VKALINNNGIRALYFCSGARTKSILFLGGVTVGRLWGDIFWILFAASEAQYGRRSSMRMKTVFIVFVALVLGGGLAGCVTESSSQAAAISRAKPWVAALSAYHGDAGDYPQRLDDLCPRYIVMKISSYDNRDPRHSWFLDYQRINNNNYKLYLDSTPCSQAVFTNGKLMANCGPNYP
jgi:hypothetical protein